jgi:tripartite-type tricarboxylate transporter receptor subunit TctC
VHRVSKLRRLIACVCIAVMIAGVLPRPAAAQTTSFPNRPVRIVIPFAAGGFADITMRVLADKLGERLSQRVIIENRPGGGGVVAAQAVTSSPADGYTLFVLAVGTAISVALFKSLPFDAEKDFAPISTFAQFDMLLLTQSSSPIRTLDDLLSEARQRGEKLNLGTTLAGSSQFLSGALFRSVAGIKATQVPFRTTPDLLIALLRGDVDVAVESYGALKSAIDDGKVRPIVSSGTSRSLPNVPTAAESGLPKFEVLGWNALFAPAGTPPEVIARLNKEIVEIVAMPEVRQRIAELGGEARGSTPEGLAQHLKKDIAKWRMVVEQAGLERQ